MHIYANLWKKGYGKNKLEMNVIGYPHRWVGMSGKNEEVRIGRRHERRHFFKHILLYSSEF